MEWNGMRGNKVNKVGFGGIFDGEVENPDKTNKRIFNKTQNYQHMNKSIFKN